MGGWEEQGMPFFANKLVTNFLAFWVGSHLTFLTFLVTDILETFWCVPLVFSMGMPFVPWWWWLALVPNLVFLCLSLAFPMPW